MRPCPKCGKPMVEAPKFPGLWQCPDYRVRLNDVPPFEFKCTGMELTREGAEALEVEILRLHIEDVKSKN